MGGDEEKTEQPSEHKLSEARKKGQVAKSQDVATAFVFLVLILSLSFIGKNILISLSSLLRKNAMNFTHDQISPDNFMSLVTGTSTAYILCLAPIFLVVMLGGVVGNILQTGWLVSLESLNPKLERLNPIEGFKKSFSMRGFIETIKVLIRTLLICVVFYTFFKSNIPVILKAGNMATQDLYALFGTLIIGLLKQLTILLVVLGGLDYILQRYMFTRDMMMSKNEVKEEYKMQEGDPFLKSRIRAKMREFMKKLMLEGVKNAKVVVTNPTHLACALRFNENEDEAPVLVAKGADHLAAKIRNLAVKHKVHLHENKPLARALYNDVEVGEQIPTELFQAVAEVIAFIERLDKGFDQTGQSNVEQLQDLRQQQPVQQQAQQQAEGGDEDDSSSSSSPLGW